MRSLETPIRKGKRLRTIGFDDAPFDKYAKGQVELAGVVCSGTRFEGMLWEQIEKDGFNSTEVILKMLSTSKFLDQVNLVLTDGLTFGGFNVIDLNKLAESLNIPCVAVMRRHPDLEAFHKALQHVDPDGRKKTMIESAGPIHSQGGFYFQSVGCAPELAAKALTQVTDTGDVPEALRLAHLIGSAVKSGQSSNRA